MLWINSEWKQDSQIRSVGTDLVVYIKYQVPSTSPEVGRAPRKRKPNEKDSALIFLTNPKGRTPLAKFVDNRVDQSNGVLLSLPTARMKLILLGETLDHRIDQQEYQIQVLEQIGR